MVRNSDHSEDDCSLPHDIRGFRWQILIKDGGWSHSKAPSLTCLMIDTGCPLGTLLRLLVGFLTTWWLLSKSKYPEKKGEQGEGCIAFYDLLC